MKRLAISLSLLASPALAHHEAVVAGSILPLFAGAAPLAVAAVVLIWRKWWRK